MKKKQILLWLEPELLERLRSEFDDVCRKEGQWIDGRRRSFNRFLANRLEQSLSSKAEV